MAKKLTERIYLDYAAATPVSESVRRAMEPYWGEHFANPGSPHTEGYASSEALSDARAHIGRALGVKSETLTFTAGGTEANNLALIGVVRAYRERTGEVPHIVTSAIEHASVLEPLRALAADGDINLSVLSVDGEGMVSPEALAEALRADTLLVSVAYANSEIGTIQPLRKIARVIEAHRDKHNEVHPYFHTDASQAPLYLDCRPEYLGVDLMTLDGQKCHGPKGVGLLFHKAPVPVSPIVYGGGQEGGLRSGTENVPLIVGFGVALQEAAEGREERATQVQALRDACLAELAEALPEVIVNGARDERIANNISFTIPGIDSEYLVAMLDTHGIAASTGSACGAGDNTTSHVLSAIAPDSNDPRARDGAVRFSLAGTTSMEDVRCAVGVVVVCIEQIRQQI